MNIDQAENQLVYNQEFSRPVKIEVKKKGLSAAESVRTNKVIRGRRNGRRIHA